MGSGTVITGVCKESCPFLRYLNLPIMEKRENNSFTKENHKAGTFQGGGWLFQRTPVPVLKIPYKTVNKLTIVSHSVAEADLRSRLLTVAVLKGQCHEKSCSAEALW